MNDQISWDPSLVKKFSSSNHFKLLNQLKGEVKKYPLSKKKNQTSNLTKDNKIDNKSIQNNINSQSLSLSNNSNNSKNIISNESTVSFNNSKNFSIYNNHSKDSTNPNKDYVVMDEKQSIDNLTTSTFKDRLNKIDMK